jgi:LmbE family N-acetylglucosaminyl deacetylase
MVPLLVFSPHLDDAVLSAGQIIAGHPGAVVATVFAGQPADGVLGEFDRACGFASGRQAVTSRRAEDATGLKLLGARPLHLDFVERQYAADLAEESLVDGLAAVIDEVRPAAVLGPVGIVHPDHQRVGRAWPAAVRRRPDLASYAYLELPYGVLARKRANRDLAAFLEAHAAAPAALPAGDQGTKAKAMLAYVSQLRWVFPLTCLAEEKVWRLWTDHD